VTVQIVVVPNALEPNRVETARADELVPWLIERFGRWPATARLYHRVGKAEYDVTPQVAADVPLIAALEGTVVVRLYPAGIDPITGGLGGLVFGAIKLLEYLRPELPNIETPQQRSRAQGGSPNNALGKRSNQARADQRVPYILGAVRSIPDLLAVPYTVWVDHIETEIGYYCVGEGPHIVSDIRDGDILIAQIEGASAEVYGPGKAPTGGIGLHDPQLTIGEPIADDVYTVYEVEAVNGQELHGLSDFTFYGSAFELVAGDEVPVFTAYTYSGGAVGIISAAFSAAEDEITDRVDVGDSLFVFWPTAHLPAGTGTAPDLTTPVTSAVGEPVVVTSLTVTGVTPDMPNRLVHIDVTIPASQQAQWALLSTYFGVPSPEFPFAQVTNLRELYVGPFFVDFEHPEGGASSFEIVCNFVAPRGLLSDDGVTTRALFVEIQVIVTPADSAGIPSGTPQSFQATLEGSAVARGSRALTMRCPIVGVTSTRCLVQARRITNPPRRHRLIDDVEENQYGADIDGSSHGGTPFFAHFSGTVVDEIRWTHCYSMSKPGNISFGDVTTIHTRTVATSGALRVKNRQLNCFASRQIQTWNGSVFGGTPVVNSATENVLFTVMKALTVGNLPDSSIDFAGIVAALDLVRASVFSEFPLGDAATTFNFTFDDADLSFEETMQAICQAAFCVLYRVGNVIKVRPEIAGDDSVLLLNHRNTLIGTQKITHTFGAASENDSVEVGYVDPLDDANNKVVVPKFGPRLRPRQIKVVGLRSKEQAYWHAHRAYQKMLYQRQSLALEATQEAELLGTRQRVLVADETRGGTQTGDVLGISGSTIRTSQPVELAGGTAYSVHLQHVDGTVDSFAVTAAPSSRELTVVGSPSVVTDPSLGVRTTYLLAPDQAPAPTAFLVTSTRPTSPLTHQVEAVNYSHMYYIADGLTCWVDFANGLSDLSPLQRLFTNVGGVVGSGVWTGGSGDYFEVLNPAEDITTANYTKLLWINATAAPTDSGLVRPASGGDEAFEITVGNLLVAGHGALDVAANYAAFTGAEHMAAVTYDATTQRMALSIDGALVDEATVAPATPGLPLRYLEGFEGTCRQVLKWGRTLSDREVMEFYLRTRP
jgi:hypothetical protein